MHQPAVGERVIYVWRDIGPENETQNHEIGAVVRAVETGGRLRLECDDGKTPHNVHHVEPNEDDKSLSDPDGWWRLEEDDGPVKKEPGPETDAQRRERESRQPAMAERRAESEDDLAAREERQRVAAGNTPAVGSPDRPAAPDAKPAEGVVTGAAVGSTVRAPDDKPADAPKA